MDNHNWVTDRISMLYCDVLYDEIDVVVCISSTPEDRLIAAEELGLAICLANKYLRPKIAKAISMLVTGKAINHADAARMAGITQTQLHRAIKWLRQQIDSKSA